MAVQESRGSVLFNLSALYRAELHRLQFELAKRAHVFAHGPVITGRPAHADTLREYVQALRDWEYVKKYAELDLNDPFLISTEDRAGRRFIEHVHVANEKSLDPDQRDALGSALANCSFFYADSDIRKVFGTTRHDMHRRSKLDGFLRRAAMAVLGGAFVVFPMVIMVLVPTQLARMLTTSIFVFAFGLVLAYYLDKAFDVVSGTAAYAAVLVVFVGTGGDGSG